MPFRAIFFDIGDTLWEARAAPSPAEFRALAAERAAAWLGERGIACDDVERASRAAWDAMEAAMRQARLTDMVEPDYGEVSRAALGELGLVVSRDDAAEFLEATYISGAEGGKAAFADARATLLELRARGFLLASVTNRAIGGERFRADLRQAGLDIGWDHEAVSVEVGWMKPHRALFAHALDGLGLRPGEAMMVGNSLSEDILGAQRVGLATAWRRSRPDAEGVTPDYIINELTELLSLPVLAKGGAP